MLFFCIADKESSLGFKLSGVETREVSTRPEAQEALRVALTMENVGVILVTSKASVFIKAEIDSLVYKQQLPLLLEIPSRGETGKRYSAGDFLKKAIGVSV